MDLLHGSRWTYRERVKDGAGVWLRGGLATSALVERSLIFSMHKVDLVF